MDTIARVFLSVFFVFVSIFLLSSAAQAATMVSISALPTEVESGGYSTLSLSTTEMASCMISGGIYGAGQSTGVPTWSGWTGPLTQSTQYVVACTGINDVSYTSSASVGMKNPQVPAATLVLSSDKTYVFYGSSAILSSNTTHVTSCVISGGIYGAGQTVTIPTWNGTTGPLSHDATFSLACIGDDGKNYNVSKTVLIGDDPLPLPRISLSASSASVQPSSATMLSSTASGVSTCTISGGIYGSGQSANVPSWSGTTGYLTQSTTFTLSCKSIDGQNYSTSTTVLIASLTSLSSVALSAVPTVVEFNKPSTLSLSTNGMASCAIAGGIYGTAQSTGVPTWSGWTGNLQQKTTYIASCLGKDGKDYDSSVAIQVKLNAQATSSSGIRLLTTTHRFDSAHMFGGWGHHLGKLLRAPNGTLWFADDTGNDVNRDPAVAYYHLTNGTWSLIDSQNLPGRVQQNTGSILLGDGIIHTYGVDVEGHHIVDCSFNTASNVKSCSNIDFTISSEANYIGVAVTPLGKPMVWWTTVGYSGAGSLSYVYFDSTWHGPYTGNLGIYNDASYIHITFTTATHFSMIAQGATGVAPNWSFAALFAEGDLGQAIASWTRLGSDPAQHISTDDIWSDPTGGVHAFDRTTTGAATYFYKSPNSSSPSGSAFSIPSAFRARLIEGGDGFVYLVYGNAGQGLWYRRYQISSISGAIPWSETVPTRIDLPSQYNAQIDGIYPESKIYQSTTVTGTNFAVNGHDRWGELMHVELPITQVPQDASVAAIEAPKQASVGDSAVSVRSKTVSTCVTLTRVLSRGSRGADVRSLQEFLIARGFLAADSATAFFRRRTEIALQTWQAQNGIVSSGSPATTGYGATGPRTRAALACLQ